MSHITCNLKFERAQSIGTRFNYGDNHFDVITDGFSVEPCKTWPCYIADSQSYQNFCKHKSEKVASLKFDFF